MARGRSRWGSKTLRAFMPLPSERPAVPRFDGRYVSAGAPGVIRFIDAERAAIDDAPARWSNERGRLSVDSAAWDCEGAIGDRSIFLLCAPGGRPGPRTQLELVFCVAPPPWSAREELQRAVDRWAIGLGRPEDAPAIAARALVEGLESPAIIDLAGSAGAPLPAEDVDLLLRRVSDEIGLLGGPPDAALLRLAAGVATEGLAGIRTEQDAARQIWELSLAVDGTIPDRLHTFVYAASEWDDRPAMRTELRRAIREAALELVGPRPGPS